MATTANAHKTLNGWVDQVSHATLEYDFTEDAGTTGEYTLATFDGKHVINKATVFVETAVTAASVTAVSLGTSATSACFLDSVAKGTLVDNYAVMGTVPQSVADAATIDMAIATDALTAGKIRLHIEYIKVN